MIDLPEEHRCVVGLCVHVEAGGHRAYRDGPDDDPAVLHESELENASMLTPVVGLGPRALFGVAHIFDLHPPHHLAPRASRAMTSMCLSLMLTPCSRRT
jgi:hypothetical protein